MKTILIPTDFSSNANNALNYAIELCKKDPAKLLIVNAYRADLEDHKDSSAELIEELARVKRSAEEKLTYLCDNTFKNTGIRCEYKSREGNMLDVIVDVIKEEHIDLVIMGTKGAHDFVGAILGSYTAKIISAAVCPVIAIPEGAPFKLIKKITYATAYHHSDIRVLRKIVEIAKLFNAQINVLHVPEKGETAEVSKHEMEAFMNSVIDKIDYTNISFQLYDGDDTESALEEYIESEATDMLVMSTHHRSFFDKLFGTSVTRRLALHNQIPLMAFHYNNKAAVKLFDF
ncbi:MAG: universal stress protein [Sphingobacteriaceae bacterium]|nr:universal stress protein [Sphingobacteriaceae bacterium]